MTEHKRVAIYARVSTADQNAESQLHDLRKYCEARRWTVVKEFRDDGVSGASEDRPALRELMDEVRKRRVDCVLVWRFDRFARSSSHLVRTLDEMRARDIDFASYQEGVDTATAHGKMVFTIIAAMAEFERELLRERVRARNRLKRARGERLGRLPIPQSKVAEILSLRGASVRAIAARVGVSKSVVHRTLAIAIPTEADVEAEVMRMRSETLAPAK
jgi:DNA invertase Pin-like site-specific DNA recombinase